MNKFLVAFVLIGLCAQAPAWADDPTLNLVLKGHHFTPAAPTIPADTRVKVTVQNLDATPAEFESDDFSVEKVVAGGQSITVMIGPLKAGSYEIHDDYNEDVSKTHLIVK